MQTEIISLMQKLEDWIPSWGICLPELSLCSKEKQIVSLYPTTLG